MGEIRHTETVPNATAGQVVTFTASGLSGAINNWMLVVRPSALAGVGNVANLRKPIPVARVELLNDKGQNVMGGRDQTGRTMRQVLAPRKMPSRATEYLPLYIHDHSQDSHGAMESGQLLGSRTYDGLQQVRVTFPATTVAETAEVVTIQLMDGAHAAAGTATSGFFTIHFGKYSTRRLAHDATVVVINEAMNDAFSPHFPPSYSWTWAANTLSAAIVVWTITIAGFSEPEGPRLPPSELSQNIWLEGNIANAGGNLVFRSAVTTLGVVGTSNFTAGAYNIDIFGKAHREWTIGPGSETDVVNA